MRTRWVEDEDKEWMTGMCNIPSKANREKKSKGKQEKETKMLPF